MFSKGGGEALAGSCRVPFLGKLRILCSQEKFFLQTAIFSDKCYNKINVIDVVRAVFKIVESNYAIAIATLSAWLVFQPMRSKTKTNRTLYGRFFPRFE